MTVERYLETHYAHGSFKENLVGADFFVCTGLAHSMILKYSPSPSHLSCRFEY